MSIPSPLPAMSPQGWKPIWRILVAILVVALLVVLGVWVWWALWANNPTDSTSDRWLNVVLGLAAVVTMIGIVGGAAVAGRYGRKASISLSADAISTSGGVIIRVRPSVQAVGIFRLRFRHNRGAVLTTTEVWADDEGGLHDGRFWDEDAVFGPSFVEGGETLMTTVVFPLRSIPARVVGWRVSIAISVPRRRLIPADSWTWADRVFVARPAEK